MDGNRNDRYRNEAFHEYTRSEFPLSEVLYDISGLPAGPRVTAPLVAKVEPCAWQ